MTKTTKIARNVTLADVAKAAGVGVMTVSRYLNEHPNVTEKTARKVRGAIEALGYRPNIAARMLMGQPSKVIGLILPNLANPFFSSIAHSVQQRAHARGYLVWIGASNDDPDNEKQLIQRMRDHHVDGILLASAPTTVLSKEELCDVPVVAIDRAVNGITVDSITIDDRLAARHAVEHLISHGYKRIACFGLDSVISSIRERIAGYEEAMKRHKLPRLPYVQCENETSALDTLRKLLSSRSPVQAIFPANGAATVLALEALNQLHYSIPKDVALLSFGDMPLGHLFHPPLSSVVQPTEQLGVRATDVLFDLITGRATTSGVKIGIPASLSIRESCGCKKGTGSD